MPIVRLQVERVVEMKHQAYAVPSMYEIASRPWNGLKVASTFSGCGGSCLGYRMAGFRVVYANEFIPAAQDTYRANHPNSVLDTRDIRDVTAESLMSMAGVSPGDLDVLDGSPPCAAFSTAGSGSNGWGDVRSYSDTKQRVDDLFLEYIRILEGVQPKVFIAENVGGLVKGPAKGFFIDIIGRMKGSGYDVKARLLNAAKLGVPQERERIIFVGVRSDIGKPPLHPDPQTSIVTVRDVVQNAVKIKISGKPNYWVSANRPSPTITATAYRLPMTGYLSCSAHIQVKDEPERIRKYTIRELKGLFSVPQDFILTGSEQQQWERLGRSVAPYMMKSVAECVRDRILG